MAEWNDAANDDGGKRDEVRRIRNLVIRAALGLTCGLDGQVAGVLVAAIEQFFPELADVKQGQECERARERIEHELSERRRTTSERDFRAFKVNFAGWQWLANRLDRAFRDMPSHEAIVFAPSAARPS